MKFARGVVRLRVPILVLTVILLIPAVLGMVSTRVNYDMLTYLPGEIDTVVGQDQLMEEFHKGAFSFLIFEDMPEKQVAALKQQVERIDHVDTVLWYDSLADLSIPMELLPKDLYRTFNTEHSTMMAVFFDSSTSADETMEAVEQIRAVCGKQCFVSGMTALVVDLRNLCEREEPIYVGLAVLMALIAMLLLLDNYLIPFVFLASIGAMILMNLGTNYFLGEISYITKALSAVLQLAVTMDYSIFLWHGYQEQRSRCSDRLEAMAQAIHNTLTSVVGSSVTTIAGFIALCFMSFTLGRDLGLVMAKGVLLGVIGCVTVLPALILVLDRPLQKLSHRPLILRTGKLAARLVRIFPVFLILFALIVVPAFYGYTKANDEVYYDLGRCLPEDINYAVSRSKLSEEFDVASTHMVLVDADLPARQVRAMLSEMEQVDGVKYAVGLESLIGDRIPAEFIPERLTSALRSENLELLLINSRYLPASDAVNAQIDELNAILKRYDPSGKGYDLHLGPRFPGRHGGLCGGDLPDHPLRGKEPDPAADPDCRDRGGHLHQSGSAALSGQLDVLHHPDLHQYDPARRDRGLRDLDDDPLQGRARRRQGQEGRRHHGACRVHPVHSGFGHGAVCRHLRRRPLLGR